MQRECLSPYIYNLFASIILFEMENNVIIPHFSDDDIEHRKV